LQAAGGEGIRAPGSHMGLGAGAGATRRAADKGYDDVTPWGQHVAEVLALLPARRHVIRGPATMLIRRDHPQPRRVCVELAAYRRRAANRPGIVPYLWQGWAVYGRLKVERHRRPPVGDALSTSVLRDERVWRGRMAAHRGVTPYVAAAWIVDTWVDPGCVVVDPFAGLGSIGLAARAGGFDYLGAELVPEYAAAASDALAVEHLTLGILP
jgi:hypothetical protein